MSTETKELITLEAIEVKKEELQQLANDYKGLVVTETTMKACDEARKLLKRNRTEIEGVVKRRAKKRLDWKRDEDAKDDKLAQEFLALIVPIEKRLESEIGVITAAQKAEAERKLKAEEDRKKAIKQRIMTLDSKVSVIREMSTIELLEELADEISMEMDSFEEFNEEGNRSIETLLQSIQNRKIVVEGQIEAEKAAKVLEKLKEEQVEEKPREVVIEELSAKMEEETILPEERFEPKVEVPPSNPENKSIDPIIPAVETMRFRYEPAGKMQYFMFPNTIEIGLSLNTPQADCVAILKLVEKYYKDGRTK